MWKKLVFYISQLVTSSLSGTLTSHRAPNTPRWGEGPPRTGALWEIYVPHLASQAREYERGGKRSEQRKEKKRRNIKGTRCFRREAGVEGRGR